MTNTSTHPDKCNVTDRCPHCGSSFSNAIGKHSCRFDLETNGRTKLCLTAEALIRASNQNTELKAEVEQLNIAGATAVEAAKLFKQWKDNLISNLMALEIYEEKHENDPDVALAAYGQWNFKHGEWASKSDATMLRSQLKRAVEIAENVASHVGWPVTEVSELMIELKALKEAIK